MKTNTFTWSSTVRDYELDSLGIVNHATFIHYLEQCRNDYARSLGIDFHDFYKKGFSLGVASIDIQYHSSLKAADSFYVTAETKSYDKKRISIYQEIKLKQSNLLLAKATVNIACVDYQTKKSCMPKILKEKLPPNKEAHH